ncbi:MAG: TlpA family protein disulfide reductase, partial [Rhodobacteraceae bacterium]|nr:TlpA family protein disulfide reductase [Paracoccaceae bacterium]
PCREEMPSLAELQTELGGDDFQVVTIATGRNPPSAVERFMDEIGVDTLPRYTDPRQALARSMGVMGLPVTVILDRDGNEVGRLMGGAEWNSESAKAILAAVMAPAN